MPSASIVVASLDTESSDGNRDFSELLNRGSHESKTKGPGATPQNVWQTTGKTQQPLTWGRRRLPFIGGFEVRLAYQFPGKPAAEIHAL